jgi:hypothetical protein
MQEQLAGLERTAMMDPREMGWSVVDCIEMAQDRNQCRAIQ